MERNLEKRVLALAVAIGTGAMLVVASPAWAEGPYGGQSRSRADAGAAMQGTMEKVNLNTASVDELARVPGIGPELAKAIVDFRDSNGPFYWEDQLLNVRGIGKVQLDSFRDRVTVW